MYINPFCCIYNFVKYIFDKIITIDSPKSHNPVQSVHFIQILSIMLAIFAHYAGIMLDAFAILLCSKLYIYIYIYIYAGIIGSSLVAA